MTDFVLQFCFFAQSCFIARSNDRNESNWIIENGAVFHHGGGSINLRINFEHVYSYVYKMLSALKSIRRAEKRE